MLKRKIFGSSNEDVEGQKKLRTEDQQIIPDFLYCTAEFSPYFSSSTYHNVIERNSNEYEVPNDDSNKFFQELSSIPCAIRESIETDLENDYSNGIDYSQEVSHTPIDSSYEPYIPNSGCSEDVQYSQEDLYSSNVSETIENQMLNLQIDLNNTLKTIDLKIPPIEYVYNPLEYAFNAYEIYIRKYCNSTKRILLVGMNPGPYGMCQTGIPFGDPKCVKEFLQIDTAVFKPEIECPFRPVVGFSSSRREQSGERLWSFFQSVCRSPENFFKNAFVFNFCPVAFMKGNGSNVTPIEIKDLKIRKSLELACEEWYLRVIRLLQPECIIAIGTYLDKKTKDVFKANNIDDIKTFYMPHPSPRALNNQNWHEKAQKFLEENNLMHYFCD